MFSLNLPNTITLTRLGAVPLLFLLLPEYRWGAAGVFLVAAGTDWLDGYLARRLNLVTDFGKILDPLVDKLLVLAPLVLLVQMQEIPAWGVFLILARELTVAGWRVQQANIQGATWPGKLKTVLQILAILALILQLPGALWLFWLAVAATIWSGWLYLVG
jgi:CDP-diacylglycerol--glycerol-3-phosphate 3-phosphatidyltransferase